jgi:putative ABC transport system permease protein
VNPLVTLRMALHALGRNLTRSFLTTLGVVIGVGAVIAMVAIGEGAKSRVEATFNSMGSSLLIVMPGTSSMGGVQGGFGTLPTLTWDDLKAIQTELPSVRWAAPSLRASAQVIADEQNWTTSVTGTTPEFFAIRDWQVGKGAPLAASDVDGGAKVVVLGQTVADKLWGAGANPVGQTVRVKGVPFQVIGVLARKGQSPMGSDYDDAVFVPSSTFRAKIQGGFNNYIAGVIMAAAARPEDTARAQRQIAALLRDRHRLAPGADDDFSIRNLTEMASAMEQSTRAMTSLLAAIALVSLLVGGIGIMNIMLVSVTERTREIGLRMAVGAKPGAILSQFLIEATTLSLLGGLIGIAFGLGTAIWVASHFKWALILRPDVMLLAVGFSALVGIGFGLYPASKASRLDPIDALRYE